MAGIPIYRSMPDILPPLRRDDDGTVRENIERLSRRAADYRFCYARSVEMRARRFVIGEMSFLSDKYIAKPQVWGIISKMSSSSDRQRMRRVIEAEYGPLWAKAEASSSNRNDDDVSIISRYRCLYRENLTRARNDFDDNSNYFLLLSKVINYRPKDYSLFIRGYDNR